MAKKNEILLSIALEGDAEIKSKLAAVGETGKRSLADIEKNVSSAGSRLEKLAKPLEGVREGLAPLLEQAGLARLGGLFGGGSGGLFSGLSSAVAPAALIASLASLATYLAKVREESDKADSRLKSLGASGSIDKLNESARKLGVSPSSLQPAFEGHLADASERAARNRSVITAPGFKPADQSANSVIVIAGGKLVSGPDVTNDEFFSAQKSFISGATDLKSRDDAAKLFESFDAQLRQNKGLTPDLLKSLGATSRVEAARLSNSIGGLLGRGNLDPGQLGALIERQGTIPRDQVLRALIKDEPAAAQAAAAARGLSGALEGAKASVERFGKSLGDAAGGEISKSLTKPIDRISNAVGGAADLIDRNRATVEQGAKIGRELGEAAPIPFLGPLGAAGGGVAGVAAAAGQELVTAPAKSDYNFLAPLQKREQELDRIRGTQPPPLEPAADSLASERERRSQELRSFQDRGISPEREGGGFLIAPEQPSPVLTPGQTQPTQPPQQFGQVDGTQLASLSTALQDALRGLVQGITDKANSLNAPDNKVQGPTDSIGIRGEGESTIKSDVADAGGALKEFAAALLDGINTIKAANAGAPTTVQAAASGGMIRHLDDGGHLSGPGTSTSDSIPAMLSDGEYVIKASSAKKLGRRALDWLNAGRFADGGPVKVWGHAPSGEEYSIVYDPSTGGAYIGGQLFDPKNPDPKIQEYLRDPGVQNAIRRSKEGAVAQSSTKAGAANGVPAENAFDIAQSAWGDLQSAWSDLLPRGQQQPSDANAQLASDWADSKKRKYRSPFVGRFGHDDDTDTYVATGGLITPHGVAHFAGGGAVGSAFAGKTLHFPHFADGGLINLPSLSGPAPNLSDLAPAGGGSAGHMDVDLRTNHGDFRMMTTEDVARKMSAAARDAANASAGAAPSWEYGR